VLLAGARVGDCGAVLEWRGIISEGTEFLIVVVSLIPLYLWYRCFLNTPRSKQLGKYLGL
jgi:hypothetical protein